MSGPAMAKVIYPRLLDCLTGSSLIRAAHHSGAYLRIAVNSELHHEVLNIPEELAVVIESILYQIIETVGSIGRPGSRDLDHKFALGGVKFDLEFIRRCFVQLSRIQQFIHVDLCYGRSGRRSHNTSKLSSSRASVFKRIEILLFMKIIDCSKG